MLCTRVFEISLIVGAQVTLRGSHCRFVRKYSLNGVLKSKVDNMSVTYNCYDMQRVKEFVMNSERYVEGGKCHKCHILVDTYKYCCLSLLLILRLYYTVLIFWGIL